uniref:Uncharacterized protein n=1 Tax=Paulinella longichromatophora TaxID=1708747 RepID=A0A2H4ZQL7_9EUKA|nr:hypothetical protein PLO_862 [Paulinella longichromatophora]
MKNRAKILMNFISILNTIPLILLGFDLLTKEVFSKIKPQIELQLIHQLKRPLKIGVYQGSRIGSISLGSSLLGPSYINHSTVDLQNIELSISLLTSAYRKRLVVKIRCRKLGLSLRQNILGYRFQFPNTQQTFPWNIDIYLTFAEPVIIRVYPTCLVAYLDLKSQINIVDKVIIIQGKIDFSKGGTIKLFYKGFLKNLDFTLRIIFQGVNLSVVKNLVKAFPSEGVSGKMIGDVYLNWENEKITCLGNLNFGELQLPLIESKNKIRSQLFQIFFDGSNIKISGSRWEYTSWDIDFKSKIYIYS